MNVSDPKIEIFALLARIADELDLPMSTFFEKPKRNQASDVELRELVDLFLTIEDPLLQGQMMSLFAPSRRNGSRSTCPSRALDGQIQQNAMCPIPSPFAIVYRLYGS